MAARRVDRESGPLVVVAAQSTEFVAEQLAGLGVVIWAAMIIALIAASIVSWVVAGRALRPLRRLAETTDRIGGTGDLAQRLPPVQSRDELGHLTSSFNAMLDRLAATTAQLERALASQRRFVADASHELRTPLTTIRANAGFLRTQPDAAPTDRAAAVADIAVESDRMARLVDDLLTLARADAGHPLERRPVDLAGVAATVAEQASRRSAGAEVRASADGPADLVGDLDALTQLVWILTDNALRHGAPPVEIATTRHPGWLVLTVTDHGPGIPEIDREQIFERFYRADAARRGEGAGLGLPIARWIAGAHGGTLTATTGPGGGAVFVAALPA
jgi:signal transduction histidine kinase